MEGQALKTFYVLFTLNKHVTLYLSNYNCNYNPRCKEFRIKYCDIYSIQGHKGWKKALDLIFPGGLSLFYLCLLQLSLHLKPNQTYK